MLPNGCAQLFSVVLVCVLLVGALSPQIIAEHYVLMLSYVSVVYYYV